MRKKLTIAWICHFTNSEIQHIIKPWNRINEIAPWITQLAKLFESEKRIELHIISPHEYIRGIQEFKLRGTYYHFYNAHIPFWGRHWPGFFRFDYWTNFFFSIRKVEKLVNKIKPDLIHLHGAENAYYASSILKFTKLYPIFITIQGFISDTKRENWRIKRRIYFEQKILRNINDFGYRTKTMGYQIKQYNPDANLHWHQYPITIPVVKKTEMKFDIVFFARVSKDKGIEDLLEACSIVKKEIPNLKVCIIGSAKSTYYNFLKNKTIELDIKDNIHWAGFLPTQQYVHNLASSAKISVLPTYHDIISGTIIESLFLKIPVVAYNIGSIHEVNEKENIVQLVEKGNIKELANKIKALLINDKLRSSISEKGYKRVKDMFNNDNIKKDIIFAYTKIIKYHHSNKK